MIWLSRLTLRQHLLLLVVLSAIPSFAIVGYDSFQDYAHLRGMAAEHSAFVVGHLAKEQQELVEHTREILKLVSNSPEIARKDFKGCDRKLGELLKFAKEYANFGVAMLDGEVVCRALPGSRQNNIADRPHFQQAIRTRDFAVSGYVVGRVVARPALMMVSPILDKRGKAAGAVFAVLPLTWFSEMIAESGIAAGYSVTVLDRGFNILARYPKDAWEGKNIAAQPLAATLHSASSGGTAEIAGLDGKRTFFAFAPLRGFPEGNEVFVAVGAPTDVLYADARSALARNIIILLLVIVIVVAIASLGADRLVVRYVGNLVEATRKLKSGDMSARVANIGGSREIAELQRTFNETAAALQSQLARIERLFEENQKTLRDLQESERRFRALNEGLEQRVAERTAELERAIGELDAFSYSISHDLRAPLRAINGFASILSRGNTAELGLDSRELLDRIVRNAQRMGEMVDDMLNFSRAGRGGLSLEEVDLGVLVAEVVDNARADYPETTVEVSVMPGVHCDRSLLRQVFENLIDNAFKFSAKTHAPKIEIGAQAGEGKTVFFVRDNGAGFDMGRAAKLFNVFQRLHKEADFPGTGVGLAIVKRVVERHGGRIWAESAPNKGAAFYFTLGKTG